MKLGEHIPTFSLEDNKGNWFNSDEFLHKKYFVLFFYPMDFTPMCTKEVCHFRDVNADFNALSKLRDCFIKKYDIDPYDLIRSLGNKKLREYEERRNCQGNH